MKNERAERDMRLALSVFGVFLFSLVTQTVVIAVNVTTRKDLTITDKEDYQMTIANCVWWSQYCADPIIYGITNREFRNAYIGLVKSIYQTLTTKISEGSSNTGTK